MKKRIKYLDFGLIIVVIILFIIGLIGLKSASMGVGGREDDFNKQITWFVIGSIISVIVTIIDYKNIKKLTIPLYLITILLLVGVLFTKPINGATSWYKIGSASIQPSEICKITTIIIMASAISYFNEKKTLNKFRNIILLFLLLVPPLFLIIKQPDYGTAVVIVFIGLIMMFAGRIDWKYVLVFFVLVAVAVPVGYNYVLPKHAKDRIDVFLNPDLDPRGAGYNIIQSKLAVGSRNDVWNGIRKWKSNSTSECFL